MVAVIAQNKKLFLLGGLVVVVTGVIIFFLLINYLSPAPYITSLPLKQFSNFSSLFNEKKIKVVNRHEILEITTNPLRNLNNDIKNFFPETYKKYKEIVVIITDKQQLHQNGWRIPNATDDSQYVVVSSFSIVPKGNVLTLYIQVNSTILEVEGIEKKNHATTLEHELYKALNMVERGYNDNSVQNYNEGSEILSTIVLRSSPLFIIK